MAKDEVWLCDDCPMANTNFDYSALQLNLTDEALDARIEEIEKGINRLTENGKYCIVQGDEENEFSIEPCDACKQPNATGHRTQWFLVKA